MKLHIKLQGFRISRLGNSSILTWRNLSTIQYLDITYISWSELNHKLQLLLKAVKNLALFCVVNNRLFLNRLPWAPSLKNLDRESPGRWKTWTLNKRDPGTYLLKGNWMKKKDSIEGNLVYIFFFCVRHKNRRKHNQHSPELLFFKINFDFGTSSEIPIFGKPFISSYKQSPFGLLFTRNANKVHTD